MKKLALLILACGLLFLPGKALAAGDDIDMGKISCKEFIDSKESEMEMMLFWIDGYMSAKSNNTVMSQEWMEKLGTHLANYCNKNPNKTIMKAMKAMPSD